MIMLNLIKNQIKRNTAESKIIKDIRNLLKKQKKKDNSIKDNRHKVNKNLI